MISIWQSHRSARSPINMTKTSPCPWTLDCYVGGHLGFWTIIFICPPIVWNPTARLDLSLWASFLSISGHRVESRTLLWCLIKRYKPRVCVYTVPKVVMYIYKIYRYGYKDVLYICHNKCPNETYETLVETSFCFLFCFLQSSFPLCVCVIRVRVHERVVNFPLTHVAVLADQFESQLVRQHWRVSVGDVGERSGVHKHRRALEHQTETHEGKRTRRQNSSLNMKVRF